MTAKKNLIRDLQQQLRDKDDEISGLKTKLAHTVRQHNGNVGEFNGRLERIETNVNAIRTLFSKDIMWSKLGNEDKKLHSLLKHLSSIEIATAQYDNDRKRIKPSATAILANDV